MGVVEVADSLAETGAIRQGPDPLDFAEATSVLFPRAFGR
jgi:hypothetical protein